MKLRLTSGGLVDVDFTGLRLTSGGLIKGSSSTSSSGNATGSLKALSASAIDGYVSGSSNASSVISSVSLNDITGSAVASAVAIGQLDDINVSSIDGSGDVGSNGVAIGSLSSIYASFINASASANASVSVSIGNVLIEEIDGYATSGSLPRDSIRFISIIKRVINQEPKIKRTLRNKVEL